MTQDATMAHDTEIRKVAFIGDYLPRKCGIATYTYDARHAVTTQYPQCEGIVVSVDDVAGGYDYPPEVRFQIPEQELEGYRRAADFLNFNDIDVVCLQHEFGVVQRGKGDKGGTVGKAIGHLPSSLQGEACLATAPGACQRQQAHVRPSQ